MTLRPKGYSSLCTRWYLQLHNVTEENLAAISAPHVPHFRKVHFIFIYAV